MTSLQPGSVAARALPAARPLLAVAAVGVALLGAIAMAQGLDPGRVGGDGRPVGLGAFEGSWKLVEARRSDVPIEAFRPYEIVLNVQPGNLNGFGPCNRYRLVADLALRDPKTMTVTVTMSMRTAASCGAVIDEHDTLYLTTLQEVRIGSLDAADRELRLRSDTAEFVFERLPS